MKKILPYIVFASLTILIVLPLYQDGFIFLLDMVFPPQTDLNDYLQNGIQPQLPLIWLIKISSYLIPVSLIQKIILSLLLFLPGVFMYGLASYVYHLEPDKESSLPGPANQFFTLFSINLLALLAGIFYILNPWVYERFLAGHWLVLAGYVFLPLLIKLCWQFLKHNTNRNFIKFTILFALYPIISPHWFYVSIFILLTILSLHLTSHKIKPNQQPLSKFGVYILILLTSLTIVNSFWLVNFFDQTSIFNKIQFNDFMAFQTQTDIVWGPYFNVLSLYGFWSSDYFLPKDTFNNWWILTFLILLLFIIGIYYAFKKKNIISIALGILFIPALLIAVGYSHWLTQPIVECLYYILPGFKGLRETAKLGGLLALSYSLLAPLGAYYLIKILSSNYSNKLNKLYQYTICLIVLLIPILNVHSMFFGFSGQLKPSDYPASWYQTNQFLIHDLTTQKVLFLPWYGYPRLSFANFKRISNPASRFFKAEIVASKNIDNVYLLETDQGIWDDKLFKLLHGFESINENIEFFKSQNITHIIMAKEMDYDRYNFLDKSEQLKKALETKDLTLYVIVEK